MDGFAPGLRDSILALSTTLRVVLFFIFAIALAESVGTYRETATQVLNDLKAGGYIDIGRKRITVLNREGLEMVAES